MLWFFFFFNTNFTTKATTRKARRLIYTIFIIVVRRWLRAINSKRVLIFWFTRFLVFFFVGKVVRIIESRELYPQHKYVMRNAVSVYTKKLYNFIIWCALKCAQNNIQIDKICKAYIFARHPIDFYEISHFYPTPCYVYCGHFCPSIKLNKFFFLKKCTLSWKQIISFVYLLSPKFFRFSRSSD